MKRLPPNTGLCAVCYRPIIDARFAGTEKVRLDAEHAPTGTFSAFLDGLSDSWVAYPYDEHGMFMGLRRREHTCPDTQLTL